MLDKISKAIHNGELPLGVFNNPDIFELEKTQIFSKSWNYLGHKSEIPKPGDYVQRYIVDDAFIVTRNKDYQISVILNACRHRGRKVCSVDKGNQSNFTCPYHGWVYDLNGAIVDIPYEKEVYGHDNVDRSRWGLLPAPKVAVWRGWIFASLDADAPAIEDYIGDAAWYLDFYTNKSAAGLEVFGVPQRWVVNADWKLAADNFVGTVITPLSRM